MGEPTGEPTGGAVEDGGEATGAAGVTGATADGKTGTILSAFGGGGGGGGEAGPGALYAYQHHNS